MYARFGLQESERVLTLDLEHGTLDARLFALAHVEDLDLEALPLRPARVHAHEHLGPVLSFGAARTRCDLELHVARIIGAAQQRPQTEGFEIAIQRIDVPIELASHPL